MPSKISELNTDDLYEQLENEFSEESDDEFNDLNVSLLNKKYHDYKTKPEKFQDTKQTFIDDSYDHHLEHNHWETFLKFIFIIIHRLKKHTIKIVIFILLLLINLTIIFSLNNNQTGQSQILHVKSISDISKSLQNLQWQINDSQNKNKNRLNDLKNYIDLKIDEFGNKFHQIDKDILQLQDSNRELVNKIENLNIDGITIDSNTIPIILDEYNNVKIIPEFENFLKKFISNSLSGITTDPHFKIHLDKLIQNHSNQIINSKIGFMNKDEILSLISLQFQQNKQKLINEIKSYLSQQSKNIPVKEIPEKLITLKSGETSKINYSLASSGARIINYLSSQTFKPKFKQTTLFKTILKSIFQTSKDSQNHNDQDEDDNSDDDEPISSPFIVLTSQDGYWKSSSINDTRLAIKFLEPMYINELSYIHPRSINGAMLTSAPRLISVYVQTNVNIIPLVDSSQWKYSGDSIKNFIKVDEFKYDLNDESVEQFWEIPDFLKKQLIKGIIFQINENYGNEFFTSVYKFKIHGLTKFDIVSIEKLLVNDELNDEFKKQFKELSKERLVKRVLGDRDGFVKVLGDDKRV